MKNQLKNIIRKALLEQVGKSPLTNSEIKFFKIINQKKSEFKTKKELLGYFISMMPFIGKSPSDGLTYYELYVMNYRPNGDYENITPEEFKDVRDMKQIKTPNINAWKFTRAKIPFKGSNLEGRWETNLKNEAYYFVQSYNWYTIFLFINNQWYENTDYYSTSTSKQISNAYPVRYDDNLKSNVIGVSKWEIQKLQNGESSFEDIIQKRKTDFEEKFKNDDELKKSQLISWYTNYGDEPNKVKYKITDVKIDNDEVIIQVKIEKGGKKTVNTGYIYPSPFSEEIEVKLKSHITQKYYKFLKDNKVKFIFNHEKK